MVFFFHFHESNLLQKSPSTSSIHGGPVKVLPMNDTQTHTLYCSSAESGNPRIWNPTTLTTFGMIGTLPELNPITVCCTLLHTPLSGISRIVFCNCRDSDVGIIAEFRINNRTVPERIRQRRFAFGKIWTQSARNGNAKFLQIMPVPQDIDQTTQDIVTILIRYSRICQDIVTIVIRLDKIG
jgi:hypothetical protein